ncbi:MAG: DM13 domain-containing protein [Chloroflexota bacterium]|nr:DM13 domain-containing protein [Chloroflexota bacterium]
MQRRPLIAVAIVIALLVIIPIAWWLASPLFINRTVDEVFPFALPDEAAMAQLSAGEQQALAAQFEAALPAAETLAQMPDAQRQAVEQKVMAVGAALPDRPLDEAMPAEPTIVAQGAFKDADSFHKGSGTVAIFKLADGNHIVRFENFKATNGPDLHVLLAANPVPTGPDDLGEYLDLGSLKGNLGNQNSAIPAGTDLTKYGSVVIYCLPFHVVFATATVG